MTARRIAKMQENVVIVDTHIFVRTGEGYYYPGLPMRLLDIIKPTSFVMIVADATEIVNRRQKDRSRTRDAISTQQVQFEIDISKLMVATCSILTGAPFIIIANNDNKMDEAVSSVAKVLSAEWGITIQKIKKDEMKLRDKTKNKTKQNKTKQNKTKRNEMKWNEMKWNEMKWNEMKWIKKASS